MVLHENLAQELEIRHRELLNRGELTSREQLAQYYATFRAQFGPDKLQGLDGMDLLEMLHAHGSRDSLVYWLEFKNDDELPAIFGSIAGGSALKFGLYCRKETGIWMTGSPKNQQELSVEQAIQMARRHRDQLVHGFNLLAQLPQGADDAAYQHLQAQMDQECPDVSGKAWGHKYFSLLYPDKLDDYHVEHYQRFHLIKLLQSPAEGEGRYLAAGSYVAIARELGLPLNHLTTMLNQRNGLPHRYWRVLVNYPDIKGWEHNWESMRDGRYIGIGWAKLGDLSEITYSQDSKNHLRSLMRTHYGDRGGWAQDIFNFVAVMEPRDIILAFERNTVLGIGRVTSPYIYDSTTSTTPNQRTVEWLSADPWTLPQPEAKGRAVREIRHYANQVQTEERILGAIPLPHVQTPAVPPTTARLGAISGQIQAVLERKNQVILYGPPGTGKTHWAMQAVQNLAAHATFGQPYNKLSGDQQQLIHKGNPDCGALVRMCTFHPAYGYEDFLEGYRPQSIAGQLSFDLRDGLFKRLCDDARKHSDHRFYLIIDEINRGDIPRIFGELLTILEQDKRGQEIQLPLSGEPFSVPSNVYVIGTMNTADRSIALLDTALRRRFGFIELMPDSSVLGTTMVGDSIPLGPWLDALNERILEHIGRDARNLQVGHAYLMDKGRPVTNWAKFARIVQEDILPLLEEYCYEDYAALAKILGTGLVDKARQRIHHELFDPVQRDQLIQALLAPEPDIATSHQAVIPEDDPLEEQDNDAVEDEATSR